MCTYVCMYMYLCMCMHMHDMLCIYIFPVHRVFMLNRFIYLPTFTTYIILHRYHHVVDRNRSSSFTCWIINPAGEGFGSVHQCSR